MTATAAFSIGSTGFDFATHFSANSIFDPFQATGTNQPIGFDQLMNLYTTYRVRASKIRMDISNTSTTIPFTIAIHPSNDTVVRALSAIVGLPYVRMKTIGTATGMGTTSVVNYIEPKVIFGDRVTVTDTSFDGTQATDPVNQVFWKIRIESLGGSTAGDISAQTRINITYWVEFFERIQLNASV